MQFYSKKNGILASVCFVAFVTISLVAALILADRTEPQEEPALIVEENMAEAESVEEHPVEEQPVEEQPVEEQPADEPEIVEPEAPEFELVIPSGERAERLVNHSPEECFGLDYNGEPVNCIDENVSYKIKHMSYILEERGNETAYASVIVLEGDIPNIDEINEYLYEKGMDEAEWAYKISNHYANSDRTYHSEADMYVTYNDEKYISGVVRYRNTDNGDVECFENDFLKSFNIDLENGEILWDSFIMDFSGFGEEFKQRSEECNGVPEGFETFGAQEYEDDLQTAPIVFYTPLGMVVGVNGEYQRNWVTIIMQDYEQYLAE